MLHPVKMLILVVSAFGKHQVHHFIDLNPLSDIFVLVHPDILSVWQMIRKYVESSVASVPCTLALSLKHLDRH